MWSDIVDLLKLLLSSSLFGTLIGAAVSIITTWLVIRKERQEWEKDQEDERQRWARDELRKIYSKCFWHVSHSNLQEYVTRDGPNNMPLQEYKRLEFESKRADDDINRARHEWFSLLLLYYPDRKSDAYNRLLNKIKNEGRVEYDDILDLALGDPRLKEDIDLLALKK
jgi:hypothetical protein